MSKPTLYNFGSLEGCWSQVSVSTSLCCCWYHFGFRRLTRSRQLLRFMPTVFSVEKTRDDFAFRVKEQVKKPKRRCRRLGPSFVMVIPLLLPWNVSSLSASDNFPKGQSYPIRLHRSGKVNWGRQQQDVCSGQSITIGRFYTAMTTTEKGCC